MIKIDAALRHKLGHCRLGVSVIREASVRGTSPQLMQEFQAMKAQVAAVYNIETLTKVPRILAVRNMYKHMSIDPSRYRPASEALVRRVLQEKNIYYINSAVDVNNFCSLKYLVPLGVYDLDKIEGEITYGIGSEGEYEGINGRVFSAAGQPVLMDQLGPFGNPTTDSKRTAVTLATTRLMNVIYCDELISDEELAVMLKHTADMFAAYNNGQVEFSDIIRA